MQMSAAPNICEVESQILLRVGRVALLATIVWAVAMELVTRLGGRMVDVELAQNGPRLASAICGREHAIIVNTQMDFVFICLYASTLALLTAIISAALKRRSIVWTAVPLIFTAAAFDVIENVKILAAVRVGNCTAADSTARSIRIPSTYKWTLLFLMIAFLGAAYSWAFRRHKLLTVAGLVFVSSGSLGLWALLQHPGAVGKALTGGLAIGAPLMMVGLSRLCHSRQYKVT